MASPLVSVLTTAYNREDYIGETIESILASDYDNFELIVVDDCSTDATREVVRRYAEQDDRVRLHENEENLGDYPNRNRAASLASGEYIKYVDADDLLYPHALRHLVRSMEPFPEAGLGVARASSNRTPYPVKILPANLYREHFFENKRWNNSPLSAIIRRSAFEAVGGFTGTRFVGDIELWLMLGARFPAVKCAAGFGFWRSHDDQEKKKEKKQLAQSMLLRYQADLKALRAPECPLPPAETERAAYHVRHRLVRHILWRVRQGRLDVATEVLIQSDLSFLDLPRHFPSR